MNGKSIKTKTIQIRKQMLMRTHTRAHMYAYAKLV